MEGNNITKMMINAIKNEIGNGTSKRTICKCYGLSDEVFEEYFGTYYRVNSHSLLGICFGSKNIPYYQDEMQYGGNGESKINYQILM